MPRSKSNIKDITIMGIYQIRNKINNKIYVGQSSNIFQRIRTHYKKLKSGYHINRHLQTAYNLYGKDVFEDNILEIISDEKLLTIAEQKWLDRLKSYDNNIGYNLAKCAEAPARGLRWSVKARSIEWKQRQSLAQRGRKQNKETVAKRVIKLIGQKRTKQQCDNIREGLKNKPEVSLETRKKQSESRKGKEAWNKGKHCSAETRKKMSIAKRGKPSWNKGLKLTAEHRNRVIEAIKRRLPCSEETRSRLSSAAIIFWQKRKGMNRGLQYEN